MALDPVAYPPLLPELTEHNRPFWDGCRAGELRLQQCDKCHHLWYPESSVCPECLSTQISWVAVSGRATLWSWITMHQNYFPAFESERPYNVAFVRLAEGPHLMSTLVDMSAELRLDAPLEVVFEEVPGDRMIPKFQVVAS